MSKDFRVAFVKSLRVGGVDVEKCMAARDTETPVMSLGQLLDHGLDVRFHGDDKPIWAAGIKAHTKVVVYPSAMGS
jgi:hypothetical protein